MRAVLLVVACGLGCGGVVSERSLPLDAAVETPVPEVGAEGGGPADGPAEAATRTDCGRICSTRAALTPGSGFCNPLLVGGDAGSPSPQPCEAWCDARWASWSAAERAAFERCATTDPLCFKTIEQCLAGG